MARPVLVWTVMLQAIDPAALAEITGGKQIIEGIRNIYNAGVIAIGLANPTATPIPTIPNPPVIERPGPVQPGIISK
jgi:hypothetical protein